MIERDIAQTIDHTLLRADSTDLEVRKLCREAMEHHFASVCINPCYVPLASALLKNTDILVCTVVGFPLGAASTAAKAYEAEHAVLEGAGEVDMVIHVGAVKSANLEYAEHDVKSVVAAAKGANKDTVVKVIIETCLLTEEEKTLVCHMLLDTGADFVKTSTGFSSGGATVEDIRLIKSLVGDKMKIKASGGIRTREDCIRMLEAGADRIGTSNGVGIVRPLQE